VGLRSFDTLAPHYPWLERVIAGDRLQRCRVRWVDQAADARDVLLCGEGHGRFLDRCLERCPQSEITVVDSSTGMLHEAHARCARAGHDLARVRFVHAELPGWRPERGRYDLIATHFFLDCFPPQQAAAVVTSLSEASTPGARWLVSEFRVPAHGWRRWRARVLLALAYRAFRMATRLPATGLPPYDSLLEAAGFQLAGRELSEWGLLTSDCWSRPPAA
jgi:ubiquinone/menaquinone biosynthesis C-methylase UbiE